LVGQIVTLFLDLAQSLVNGKLPGDLTGIQFGFQFLNFSILRRRLFLQFTGRFGHSQINGRLLVFFGQCESVMQGLVKLTVPHLLENVRVAGFVNFEGFAAVRAIDFLHYENPSVQKRHCF